MDFGPELHTYKNKTIGVYGGKFYPFHKGHLACILKAQSQVDILFVIVQYDEEHEKMLAQNAANFTYTNHRIRERWITEEVKDFPNIRVFAEYEPRSENYMNDSRLETIYTHLNEKLGGIDKVFSNDPTYTPYFKKYLPNAEHIVLFNGTPAVETNATLIRDNLNEQWDNLPQTVQTWYTPRISICGIESAGKTHLTKMLAKHYNTTWVPEYGRTYYDELNGCFDIDLPSDYDDITAGHLHLLNQGQKTANRLLLVDTDLIYTQYFHIRSHGYKNSLVDQAIINDSERLTHRILLTPHNPYDLDGTRKPVEGGQLQRVKDHTQLEQLYNTYNKAITIIDEPNRQTRFEKALQTIQSILANQKF